VWSAYTLRRGATDYVLKNRLTRLAPAVSRALRESQQRREREQAEERLRRSHDQLRALTGHLQFVREEERTRIAREVHDELGQALTGLKLDLAWLDGKFHGPREIHAKIKAMSSHIDETIHAIRRIATELRPGVLDSLGLAAAIEWQAAEFQERTGVKCEAKIEVTEMIQDQEVTTACFRIFQLSWSLHYSLVERVCLVSERDQGWQVRKMRSVKRLTQDLRHA